MKKLPSFFILVTLINICIFFFREHFQFVRYSTYEELYGNCDKDCTEKWKAYMSPYSDAGLIEAQKILQPLRLDTASTVSKIRLIGNKLYSQFHLQSGVPGNKVSAASPVEQYKILTADSTEKLWCGTWAQMFSYFCWSQNIVCRNIEIMKPGDHHVFNECYIPELQQWIMVDLTNGILWPKADGSLLNVQEFLNHITAQKQVSFVGASTMQAQPLEGSFEGSITSYYKKEYPCYYYHLTNTEIAYKTSSKIKRYIFPDYWYEIFTPVRKPNILFYIKVFFLALWFILLVRIFIKRITK